MPYSPRTIVTRYLNRLMLRSDLPAEVQEDFLHLNAVTRSYTKPRDILLEGDSSSFSFIVASGMVSRARSRCDGRRQILSLHIPGDMVYLQSSMGFPLDHDVRVHSNTRLLAIAGADLIDLAQRHSQFSHALWLDMAVEAGILREHAVSLGSRDARQRILHLLMELTERYRAVGMAEEGRITLPLNQTELSEVLGITVVHLNRTVQALRREGLVEWQGHSVRIVDHGAAEQAADFNPSYLHLEKLERDRQSLITVTERRTPRRSAASM